MSHEGIAPTRKNIVITIHGTKPSEKTAKADAGNTITFINMDHSEKILRFAVSADPTEFHPIGLILDPGPDSLATIVAVNPNNGKDSSTVFYSINTVDKHGNIEDGPDDDTYQVIVGSGGNDQR
jgi:hypothetical protein